MHLCGPEAQRNAEILSAANDREQAAQVFKYVKQIVQLSPRLTDMLDIVESKKRVVWHAAGSVYMAISADAKRKHGLNPHVVIYDELAQSISRELYDTLETSQGAQECPLFYVISTQSNDPQHPLSELIDDGLSGADEAAVVHLYEVPEEVENIFDPKCWYSANPGLGDFRSMDELQRYADKAERLPSFENVMRNLYLNQRVSFHSTLFTPTLWRKRERKGVIIPEGSRVFLGLDLSTRIDLCALAVFSEEYQHLDAHFWKPEQLLREHGDRDRFNYESFFNQGLMEPCPGKAIDPEYVAQKIVDIHQRYEVVGLAYDRYRMETIKRELVKLDVDASEDDKSALWLVPWGQGFVGMAPAIEAFEEAVIDEKITHSGNPVLTWNIGNAVISQDPSGNRKFDKEKARLRIDGAVAAAMAIGLHERMKTEAPGPSVYEESGIKRF